MRLDKDKVSYVLGQSIGNDFKRQEIDIDPEIFVNSFKSAYKGEQSTMTAGEMQQVIGAFQQAMQKKKQAVDQGTGEKNLEEGQAFLEDNKSNEGVQVTKSGLQYKVIKEGDGKQPTADDQVVTHYEGRTIDGTVFDSSYNRGNPASFPVKGVIKGWQEALQLMQEGAKWELYIPSDLAYGAAGAGSAIKPHSTLLFTIELITVE